MLNILNQTNKDSWHIVYRENSSAVVQAYKNIEISLTT